MLRMKRLDLPGLPQHVVQRGNDRERPCFSDSDSSLRTFHLFRRSALVAEIEIGVRVHFDW